MEKSQQIKTKLITAIKGKEINLRTWSEHNNIDYQLCLSAANSLIANDQINSENVYDTEIELTEKGYTTIEKGSPEVRVCLFMEKIKECSMKEFFSTLKASNISTEGFSESKKKGWIKTDKGKVLFVKSFQEDVIKRLCQQLKELSREEKELLVQRKMVKEIKIHSLLLTRGEMIDLDSKNIKDLTSEMLLNGEWKNLPFKKYNFNSLGKKQPFGSLHPLKKVCSQYRNIFLEMGFEEMPTNRYVESSFWNFDSLFQPQQHPVRDAHDTFFLEKPKYSNLKDEQYINRVKEMHENGGYGSIGWRYDWSIEESKKNILRTHTTAVSSRMLYQLAQEKQYLPKKYFSIDKVFRNESLDATHLAEFHQIEGLVADYNLTLGDLMGIISEFFKKLGISPIKFKPAYNPYTEPSLEIFSYHKGLKSWVEIGNSGIFRPEMLLPMGLPPDVRVIAWGLSAERPTMIMYGLDNIKELCGCDLDIKRITDTNPIIRLEN